jgi:hypothetical protein
MARMTSFAGEFEVRFLQMRRSGDQLVIQAQMGVWDSEIVFQPEDTVQMLRLMAKPSVLSYFLLLPFARLRQLIGRRA